MEDYIEMIYRKTLKNNSISVKNLAYFLNVQPSSVSKMAKRLKLLGLIEFEKYGEIILTKKGNNLGNYFLWRHNVLKKFFYLLNKDYFSLEQVEKIEHFIDYNTIKNINNLINRINL